MNIITQMITPFNYILLMIIIVLPLARIGLHFLFKLDREKGFVIVIFIHYVILYLIFILLVIVGMSPMILIAILSIIHVVLELFLYKMLFYKFSQNNEYFLFITINFLVNILLIAFLYWLNLIVMR